MSIHPPLKETIVPRNFPLAFLFALLSAVIAVPAHALVQRAFVSSNGNNANVATNCAVTAPCKTFAGALPVVATNGEIVALDTAPYGSVTLDRSISLTAAPGVYAGISVFAGAGITIATPGISVVLRGITINGQGGAIGINMTAGAALSVENCVIANFQGGAGILVIGPMQVRIVNTLIRDSDTGIQLQAGATAVISGSKFLSVGGGGIGIDIANITATTTSAYVSDTIVSGFSQAGIRSISDTAGGAGQIYITRSTVTNNNLGVSSVASGGGISSVTISDSMVAGCSTGLIASGAGTLQSMGNNNLSGNSTNKSPEVTSLIPQ